MPMPMPYNMDHFSGHHGFSTSDMASEMSFPYGSTINANSLHGLGVLGSESNNVNTVVENNNAGAAVSHQQPINVGKIKRNDMQIGNLN